jgi:uncharacterized protein (UPF0335 family)
MQQVGDPILKEFLSSFESTINKKDLIIKALIERLEQKENELKELKETIKGLGLFMKDLGEV